MTAPPPLLAYRPDWEEQWDAANARHLAIKAVAFPPRACALPRAEKVRIVEELRISGEALCRRFEVQFRTTDDGRSGEARDV